MLTRRRTLAALLIAAVAALPLHADAVFTDDGVAIRGTDPVAYFTEGRPVAGDPAISHEWMGATWTVSTEAHRDAFAAEPEAYAPQYGGFCAYAVAHGELAPTDPDAWKIVDGRLYLNFDRRTQRLWERDVPGFIAKADASWAVLR